MDQKQGVKMIDQFILAHNVSQIVYQTRSSQNHQYTKTELIQKINILRQAKLKTNHILKGPFFFKIILVCIMFFSIMYELTSTDLNNHSPAMCLFYMAYSIYLLTTIIKNKRKKIDSDLEYYEQLLRRGQYQK